MSCPTTEQSLTMGARLRPDANDRSSCSAADAKCDRKRLDVGRRRRVSGKGDDAPRCFVHRDHGGTSADVVKIVRTLGGGRWQTRLPHATLSVGVAREIAWHAPVYQTLPAPQRLLFALRCANAAMDWPAQAWYISDPLVTSLETQGLVRPATHSYRRLQRALLARRHRSVAR